MERESVIERVRKLLALAGNNGNVNEAGAAMAAAQRLMLEHKLAHTELKESADTGDSSARQTVLDEAEDYFWAWKSILMNNLSKASCCESIRGLVYEGGKKVGRYWIVGTEADAAFVSYTYRYLCSEIERLCSLEGKGKGMAFRNAFRRGAVSEICRRLQETRRQVVRESARGETTALTILRKADGAVAAYVKQHFSGLRATRAAQVSDSGGFSRGQAAGRDIDLPGRDQRRTLGADPKRLAK